MKTDPKTDPKTDLKKLIATYSAPRGRFALVTVAPARFLMIDGQGDPNTAEVYREAVSSVYALAYALKLLSKRDLGRDYVVMPLEALWWSQDMASFTTARDKSLWEWTLMNLVPDWLTPEHEQLARRTVERTGGAPLLDAVRFEPFDEGLAVQTLHVGPYDEEGPVLEAMHEHIATRSLRRTGKHHEIYLGDPRRAAPERLRTILRQPVAAAG